MASAAGREVGEEAEIELLARERDTPAERRLHHCLRDKSDSGRIRGTLRLTESPVTVGILVPSRLVAPAPLTPL